MFCSKFLVRRTSVKALFPILVVACAAGYSAPGVRSDEEVSPSAPGSVALVPFVLDGRLNDELTGAFLDALSSRETSWKMVDGPSVQKNLGKGQKFASNEDVQVLLKAAKKAGAEAVILGRATRYKVLDAPGISLQVSMLDVDSGAELHSDLTKASAWTSKRARREVAKTAAKKLHKGFNHE